MAIWRHIFSLALVLLLTGVAGTAYGWDREEHRLLADSVYAEVARITDPSLMTDGALFGLQVAQFAADDLARGRFHAHGKTIMEQLRSLAPAGPDPDLASDPYSTFRANVIAGYLGWHLEAMHSSQRMTESATDPETVLATMLMVEAKAQGYLADAFSAGHILSNRRSFLSELRRRNRIETHDFHRNQGVYVINSNGQVWQTFGDGLMLWYRPAYRRLLKACRVSLMEVMTVYFVTAGLDLPDSLTNWLGTVAPGQTPATVVASWLTDQSGVYFYETAQLPSLKLLPMPVAASWSYRTTDTTHNGERIRHHYPQLSETGLHDPDLNGIDVDFLYSRSDVPSWLVPVPLDSDQPEAAAQLIKHDPDWSSVRWVQERVAKPSYKGLLISLGGQLLIGPNDTRSSGTVGLGYGLWDDLLLIKNVSVSATYMPSFYEPRHKLLFLSGGLGIDLPGEGIVHLLRFDIGPAFGLTNEFHDVGMALALGLDSRVFRTPLSDAGITWRLKYQWFNLDQSLDGPALEMIWQ
jgi:hypothetical protein